MEIQPRSGRHAAPATEWGERLRERGSAEAYARGRDPAAARERPDHDRRECDQQRRRPARRAGHGGQPLGERERPGVAIVAVEIARGPRDVGGLEGHRPGEEQLESQSEGHEGPHVAEATAAVPACQIRPRSVTTGAILWRELMNTLVPDISIAEKVLRSATVHVFLFVAFRLGGKRPTKRTAA